MHASRPGPDSDTAIVSNFCCRVDSNVRSHPYAHGQVHLSPEVLAFTRLQQDGGACKGEQCTDKRSILGC